MQGWCFLKTSRGRYDHVYGLLKQFDPNRRTPEGE